MCVDTKCHAMYQTNIGSYVEPPLLGPFYNA
jgi:hypothetical protein